MNRDALDKAVKRTSKLRNFLAHTKPDSKDAKECSKYAQAVYAMNVVRDYLSHLEGKHG